MKEKPVEFPLRRVCENDHAYFTICLLVPYIRIIAERDGKRENSLLILITGEIFLLEFTLKIIIVIRSMDFEKFYFSQIWINCTTKAKFCEIHVLSSLL